MNSVEATWLIEAAITKGEELTLVFPTRSSCESARSVLTRIKKQHGIVAKNVKIKTTHLSDEQYVIHLKLEEEQQTSPFVAFRTLSDGSVQQIDTNLMKKQETSNFDVSDSSQDDPYGSIALFRTLQNFHKDHPDATFEEMMEALGLSEDDENIDVIASSWCEIENEQYRSESLNLSIDKLESM